MQKHNIIDINNDNDSSPGFATENNELEMTAILTHGKTKGQPVVH